ncbi:DNA-invertase hin [Exiguobacterium sp. 8H]|uniref:recombinase family protein n=1 Tax=unclassified Exiguobacterium TaxID=2644629 RepID=UPI0012F0E94D|nr:MULTISPECIES: recombinase family protein [unclassified Exiguobacterium]VXB82970.1 DNA-invertase hin [Exiguobacterium sp. 8H]VXC04769.1 DNA-invertase hin [Exiguobacterium sp. 8A]
MTRIGYARVSTAEQKLDAQLDELNRAGCTRIFQEKASSVKRRSELAACLDYLREGDTLVVWKLDRLGRTTRQLLALVDDLKERGVHLHILTLGVDTGTAAGRLFFTMMAGLAEMERELIRERTRVGLDAARARGRTGGRKPIDPGVMSRAMMMYGAGMTVSDISKTLGISRSTFYKYMRQSGGAS